jgi:hypothetical protein
MAKVDTASFTESLDIVVSPVKLKPDGDSEVIVMVMLKETINTSPTIKIVYQTE